MKIAGIDPGLSGAIAILDEMTVRCVDAPTLAVKSGKKTRQHFDLQAMTRTLRDCSPDHVFIESVHSMPAQGVASSFQFGMGFGMWQGILAAMGIPYTLVTPQRWKKAMLADMGSEKSAARLRAGQLFPSSAEQFARVKDDGRAEAALIAEYGRRVYQPNAINQVSGALRGEEF